MDEGVEQQALGVYQDMTLLASDLLAAVIARRVNAAPPFFCALDALAIDDRSARAGVPPRQLPARHIERVVNAAERAVVVPSVEVVVQGAARRQVLGEGPWGSRPTGSLYSGYT